jgi:hypothetical protein
MDTISEIAAAAATSWLERTKKPEYWAKKREKARLRWQLAVLKRKVRRSKDYTAIALLGQLEAEMLSRMDKRD